MKLFGHGYTEKKVEVYEMSMGDLVLTISRKLIEKNLTDIEIRVVDCFEGTVDRWDGMNGLIIGNQNADYRVNVYDIKLMHNNDTDRDYLKVIISDEVEG